MGLTLPLLTRAVLRDEAGFGRVLGALYGWNTLGAMAGVVAGELFLVGRFGVRGTALAAGGLNLFAAAVASLLSIWESEYGDRATQGVESTRHRTPTPYLFSAFLGGFCLLALEVVWFRFLLLFVKGSSLAFPVMLGVVLAGIALGGLAASLLMLEGNYEYFKILDNNLADVMNKNITPEEAARRIEAGWNKVTNDVGRENQIKIWRKGVESGIYLDKF